MNLAAMWKMDCGEETEGEKSSEETLVIQVGYIFKICSRKCQWNETRGVGTDARFYVGRFSHLM